MSGHYDPALVALSIFIAIIASFVALDLTSRVAAARDGKSAYYWLAGGSISMGTGVWAMHFVGMLALSLPIPVSYEVPTTILSWFTAVLSSALALYVASRPQMSMRGLALAGIAMGTGIVAMHYLGMEALCVRPRVSYDPAKVMLSALIAVLASTAAMWLAFQLRLQTSGHAWRKKLLASLLMGAAIAGMHYTGMQAAHFAEAGFCVAQTRAFDSTWMAAIVGSFAVLFLVTTSMISMFVASPPTIRSRLIFLVISCMLPVSLLFIGFVIYNFERTQQQLITNVIATARSMTATIDKDLSGVESGLLALSTSPLLTQNNYLGFYAQANAALSDLHASAITLAEADGQQLIDTRRPYGTALPLSENSPQSARDLAAGRAAVSDLFTSVLDHEPAISISVPVQRGWTITHRLSATIFPDRMSTILARQKLPPSWIVVLLDSTGTVVARTHDQARFLGKKGAPRLLDRLRGSDEGAVDLLTLEGIQATSIYSRSPNSRWTVAIGIPTDAIKSDMFVSLWWLLGMLALLLAASIVIAWSIGGAISRSIHALTGPALALGAGDTVTVPEIGLAEADAVGKALTRAAAILASSQYAAQHDVLTGIANRSLFRESVQHQLALAKRNKGSLAVLYIDLDGFKTVNDLHGHATGDLLLKKVAARIQLQIRECDIAARLGGDEFAVLLADPGTRGGPKVAGKIVDALSTPMSINGISLLISASVGVAMYPDDAETVETLMKSADEAMYKAKKAGKQRFEVSAAAA